MRACYNYWKYYSMWRMLNLRSGLSWEYLDQLHPATTVTGRLCCLQCWGTAGCSFNRLYTVWIQLVVQHSPHSRLQNIVVLRYFQPWPPLLFPLLLPCPTLHSSNHSLIQHYWINGQTFPFTTPPFWYIHSRSLFLSLSSDPVSSLFPTWPVSYWPGSLFFWPSLLADQSWPSLYPNCI